MKNIIKLLFASLFIVNFSCHDSENVIDGVLDYETYKSSCIDPVNSRQVVYKITFNH
jgi:hypothetical protein